MSRIEQLRLNKYVAQQTSLSRREADRLIQEGKVEVNGVIEINPATRVSEQDTVRPLFDPVKHVEDKLTICINKPTGYVVSHSKREGSTVYQLLTDIDQQIAAIGRLDKDSEGLLLLSNDSSLPRHIIGEDSRCEKEYIVTVNRSINDIWLGELGKSMNILGHRILPATVTRNSTDSFTIILTEGKNRQIRRMVRKIGFEVISLRRMRIAHIHLDTLKPGEWRVLSKQEVQLFKDLKA